MAERLDPRLILDAPLMLASDGLVLADPTPDEILEMAAFDHPESSTSVGHLAELDAPTPDDLLEPLPSTTRVTANDDGKAKIALADTTATSSGSSSASGTATLYVSGLGGVSEWANPTTSKFQFNAYGCGVPPPHRIFVDFYLTGSATPGADYQGPLVTANGHVEFYMVDWAGSNTWGRAELDFTAYNDAEDESTESIGLVITSATTNTGATVTIANSGLSHITSGDYTIKWDENPIDLVLTGVAERTIGVKVTHAGSPVANAEVEVLVADTVDTELALVVGGVEKRMVFGSTDGQGRMAVTVRLKSVTDDGFVHVALVKVIVLNAEGVEEEEDLAIHCTRE